MPLPRVAWLSRRVPPGIKDPGFDFAPRDRRTHELDVPRWDIMFTMSASTDDPRITSRLPLAASIQSCGLSNCVRRSSWELLVIFIPCCACRRTDPDAASLAGPAVRPPTRMSRREDSLILLDSMIAPETLTSWPALASKLPPRRLLAF